MWNKFIEIIKQLFILTKSEQRGVIVLTILIFLSTIFYFSIPYFVSDEESDFREFEKEIAEFREEQQLIRDSLYVIRLQNTGAIDRELARQKLKPFSFDPNQLPEDAWAAMGFTKKQIKSIKNYEAKGGKFRRKEDLKKMYAISEAEYVVIEPYIHIKSRLVAMPETKSGFDRKMGFLMCDVNKADSGQLVHRLKLAPWLAARIIKYRNLLGGFYQPQQLSEVYGFDSVNLSRRIQYIKTDPSKVKQLDLNNSTFKELVRHPYISYEITQYIVNTRRTKGGFKTVQEIQDSPLISESLLIKLKPYLTVGE